MIKYKINIQLSLLQILHNTFKLSAYILPGLPTDVNLGFWFFEDSRVIIDFAAKTLKINEIVIEIPIEQREPIALSDQLI